MRPFPNCPRSLFVLALALMAEGCGGIDPADVQVDVQKELHALGSEWSTVSVDRNQDGLVDCVHAAYDHPREGQITFSTGGVGVTVYEGGLKAQANIFERTEIGTYISKVDGDLLWEEWRKKNSPGTPISEATGHGELGAELKPIAIQFRTVVRKAIGY